MPSRKHQNRATPDKSARSSPSANDAPMPESQLAQKDALDTQSRSLINALQMAMKKGSVETCKQSPLIAAVQEADLPSVKLLLDAKADCNAPGLHGDTALHQAASLGLADIARYLVEEGNCLVDQRNDAGCTALYRAVQRGQVSCAQLLLDSGAQIDAATNTGATPVYIAADRGYCELVDLLLSRGCNVKAATELQMTPLLIAAFNGREEVVRTLVAHGADLSERGPGGATALYVAAQEGRSGVVHYLLSIGCEVDVLSDGCLTPSLIAAMQGRDDIVRSLLAARASLDVSTDQGSNLAVMSARHGHINVLKLLVEFGGAAMLDTRNPDGMSVLSVARKARHKDIVQYIEGIAAEQKDSDMAKWEANLSSMLEDMLEPDPTVKRKTRRKKKAGVKRSDDGDADREVEPSVVQEASSARKVDDKAEVDADDDVERVAPSVVSELVPEASEHANAAECISSSAARDDVAGSESSCSGWVEVPKRGRRLNVKELPNAYAGDQLDEANALPAKSSKASRPCSIFQLPSHLDDVVPVSHAEPHSSPLLLPTDGQYTWDMMEKDWQAGAVAPSSRQPPSRQLEDQPFRIKNTFIDIEDLEPSTPMVRTTSCPARVSRRICLLDVENDGFMLEPSPRADEATADGSDRAPLRFEPIFSLQASGLSRAST
eukprot:TRINITY_DN63815_c0_g1_i1.p1 TRINITY_DN63815_c0_g1~~TRINITY_DN63815_c0_g1_i1.p1  ORF type:complete len:662 (-),score=86.51 TRINITY_DN63815_c0_g1_i1:429-2414(-)